MSTDYTEPLDAVWRAMHEEQPVGLTPYAVGKIAWLNDGAFPAVESDDLIECIDDHFEQWKPKLVYWAASTTGGLDGLAQLIGRCWKHPDVVIAAKLGRSFDWDRKIITDRKYQTKASVRSLFWSKIDRNDWQTNESLVADYGICLFGGPAAQL